MQFQPSDTAQFPASLSPRALFMYLRAISSMYQLPIAVASPLLSLQKVHGKNTVRDVGMKLHKPRVEAQYILVPYPLLEDAITLTDVANDSGIQWVTTFLKNNSLCATIGSGHSRAGEEFHRRLRSGKEC